MVKKGKVKEPKDPGPDADYSDPQVFQEYTDYTFSKKGNKEFFDRERKRGERLSTESKQGESYSGAIARSDQLKADEAAAALDKIRDRGRLHK